MGLRNKTSAIIDTLLEGIGGGLLVTTSIVAPNALQALEKPLELLIRKGDRAEAKRIARYLKQQKLVQTTELADGSFSIQLTINGKRRQRKARFERLGLRQKTWDGNWRLLSFDIPERHKALRDYLSQHIKRIGFAQLQRSTFIYPYPIDDFIAILEELHPEVTRYLAVMTASELNQHNKYVHHFRNILP